MPMLTFRNPPEVVKNGSFSKESDYWSFGIVCWELSQALISPPGTKKKDILPYNKLKDDEVFSVIIDIIDITGLEKYFETTYKVKFNSTQLI